MRKSDICFYLSITKEENSAFLTGNNVQPTAANAQNPDSPDKNNPDEDDNQDDPTSPTEGRSGEDRRESQPIKMPNFVTVTPEGIPLQTMTIQINVDHIGDEERRKSITPCPSPGPHSNFNLLTLPTNVEQKSSETFSNTFLYVYAFEGCTKVRLRLKCSKRTVQFILTEHTQPMTFPVS